MRDYIKIEKCKCFNCHAISMEKTEIDYDRIKSEMQIQYNDGFNAGYAKAKEELRQKLRL